MKDKKQIPSRTSRGLNWEKTHKLFASLSLFHPGYAYNWQNKVKSEMYRRLQYEMPKINSNDLF